VPGKGCRAAALSLIAATAVAAATSAGPEASPETDVFYEALFGDPVPVDVRDLLDAPGRFVGRAVRTRGRLESAGDRAPYSIAGSSGRALLRLEPQAAAVVGSRSDTWVGKTVEAEGLFYRDAEGAADASYALRAWRVQMTGRGEAPGSPRADAPLLTLQDLVYGGGRYDRRLVRVRGSYRGANVEGDLPESSRKSARDWVLKDGSFAVWVGGRDAPAGLSQAGRVGSDLVLDVVGVATTSGGVVRIAAREVEISLAPSSSANGRARAAGDPGIAEVPPHVSFAYPVEGERLGPRGQVILQFSKDMDPARFEARVRMLYRSAGRETPAPRLSLAYRVRYRALVITPEPRPPRDVDVVVDLLEGIIDVDGRALSQPEPVLRFRSAR
jgi:hypothetical protein